MECIIKQATILSTFSSYHMKKMDMLIKDGKIVRIDKKIETGAKSKIVTGKQLYCVVGLADIGTHSGEPGFEHRETISSLTKAAKAGGYTTLLPFPNTNPYIQTKSDLKFLIHKGRENFTRILPIGALSIDGHGVDIAEYYDMHTAGAVGFSDGLRSCQDSGLLLRALLYVKAFEGVVIHHPDDKTLMGKGLIHEGLVSTSLGLKGVPSIAEVAMIQRDLLLQQYADSRLLVHAISTKESIEILAKEKKVRSKLFVSVPYLNIIATDKKLENFDVNYKVRPVLREEEDRKALVKGLINQSIDAIVSNHTPIDEDGKKVEFPYADVGASGLETSFRATIDALSKTVDLYTLVSKFNEGPRNIFNLSQPAIEPGEIVDLCVFDLDDPGIFDKSFSLSDNNPLLHSKFKTSIKATLFEEDMYIAK